MANTYLTGNVSVMLDRIDSSRQLLEVFKGQSFNALLRRLKVALRALYGVLPDAEERAEHSPEVKYWFTELIDALYQAEDVVDEISTEASKRKVVAEEGGFGHLIKNFIIGSEALRKKIEPKLEEVVRRLENLADHIKVIRLKEHSGPLVSLRRQRSPSSSDLPHYKVVGREDDRQAVVKLLLSYDAIGNQKPGVISMVGMPGIGKTTLAQVVYNDNRVTEHFDLKVWICVGEIFDVFRVTKAVLQEITSAAINIEDLPSLQIQLKEKLSGKRFLLILDDFWAESNSAWENFMVPLTGGPEGSRIVLTTRSEIVSAITQSIQSYPLKLMADEDCWELISRSVFGNIIVGSINPELEAIGKKIAKQCKGLPLAAKAIASNLHSMPNPEEWYAVSSDFSNYTVGVLPVLKLSYDPLSSQLKRCFAFCSIFPKGYVFDREKLVLLWMAIDILSQPRSNKQLEDIGYEYLDHLIARSFFQPLDSGKTNFVMHDLMNDLAKSIAGDFCFRLEDNKTPQIPERARHFSFSGSQCDASMVFYSIRSATHLRTILPFDLPPELEASRLTNKILHDLLLMLPRLRVLCLSHYHITNLPQSFVGLKHLRYLDLSSTRIRVLPDIVGMLYNLQTLLLSNCSFLTRLPTTVGKLINLHYLDLVGTPLVEMPTGISKLRGLQKLSNFVMGRLSGAGLRELRELSHLRGTLHISELQNVAFAAEARGTGLRQKPFLEGLVLKWSENVGGFFPGKANALACNPTVVLKHLKPHPNLKMLGIESYGGEKFPVWLGDNSYFNMVSISLSSCSFCLSLPPLGQLPSLKDLVIENFGILEKVGHEFFYGEDDPPPVLFQSLQTLKFYKMPKWEEWNCRKIDGVIFPCLQKLIIQKCPKLTKDLPEDLPSFTEVIISGCPIKRTSGGLEISSVSVSPSRDSSKSTKSEGASSTQNEKIDPTPTDVISELSLPKEEQQHEDEVLYKAESESSSQHSEQVAVISESYPGYSSSLTEIYTASDPHLLEASLSSGFPDPIYPGTFFPGSISSQPYQKSPIQSPGSGHPGNSFSNRGTSYRDELDFESLKVTEISQLMELPPGLQSLYVEGCDGLHSLPETLMGSSPNIRELFIVGCQSLESFPDGHPPTSLKTLYIRDCRKLKFAETMQAKRSYSQLEYLLMESSCSTLPSFPLALFPKLKSLSITDCGNFKSFSVPAGLGDDRIALEALEIRDCPKLELFPKGGLPTSNLTSMLLSNCKNLRALPEGLLKLKSLLSLFINECPELETVPRGGFPLNLRTLCINHSYKLTPRVEWGLCDLENLHNLEIEGGNDDIESFPDEGLLPQSLFSLRISEFHNLKTLNYKGLRDLIALETLEISGFDKLPSLPDEGLPSSLSCMHINNCLLLKEKLLEKETEWCKISHIPHVEIDGEIIS